MDPADFSAARFAPGDSVVGCGLHNLWDLAATVANLASNNAHFALGTLIPGSLLCSQVVGWRVRLPAEVRVLEPKDDREFVCIDEESLLIGIRAHNPEALSEVYDRFSKAVYSVALRILRVPSAAEEVLQEIFLHLWRNPDSYSSNYGPLWARLVLAARNRSIEVLRCRRPEDRCEDILVA